MGTFGTDMIAIGAINAETPVVTAVDLLLDRALTACGVAQLPGPWLKQAKQQ